MKKISNRPTRFLLAAIFTIIGLGIEFCTILWVESFLFIILAFLGLISIGVGLSFFLTSLVNSSKNTAE
ncbi:MAG: hypothetical protein PF588_06205 [Candidatus Kapabacteria bacterium]|jgi:heme/copper-type cytochrome/quinol oxidase subunit 4|nr:hypothetical protein [Candidatus Kapabacteria bacterium]